MDDVELAEYLDGINYEIFTTTNMVDSKDFEEPIKQTVIKYEEGPIGMANSIKQTYALEPLKFFDKQGRFTMFPEDPVVTTVLNMGKTNYLVQPRSNSKFTAFIRFEFVMASE